MNKAEQAGELFMKGYNCAQAVLGAFAAEAGLTMEQAARLAGPFGAGMGMMRETCGAVSGMFLVAGALKGYADPTSQEEKKRTYALVRTLAEEFTKQHGSIICRELLNLRAQTATSTEPAARTEAYFKERPCLRIVRDAAALAEQLLA